MVWSLLAWSADVDPARVKIAGAEPSGRATPICCPPASIAFTAAVDHRQTVVPPPSTSRNGEPNKVDNGKKTLDFGAVKIAENDQLQKTSTALVILMGFLGGLILNIMPCVLPVIGLKLLSFLEQSGHSRGRAFMLNLWYSLGLIAVFLVLATLAVTLGFGWGHLFSFNGFNITLSAVVFAMGLKFPACGKFRFLDSLGSYP